MTEAQRNLLEVSTFSLAKAVADNDTMMLAYVRAMPYISELAFKTSFNGNEPDYYREKIARWSKYFPNEGVLIISLAEAAIASIA